MISNGIFFQRKYSFLEITTTSQRQIASLVAHGPHLLCSCSKNAWNHPNSVFILNLEFELRNFVPFCFVETYWNYLDSINGSYAHAKSTQVAEPS